MLIYTYYSSRQNQGAATACRFPDTMLSSVQEATAKLEKRLLVIDGATALSPANRRNLWILVHGKRLPS